MRGTRDDYVQRSRSHNHVATAVVKRSSYGAGLAFALPTRFMVCPCLAGRTYDDPAMFCNCLHAEESHHDDGCHALHRDGDGLMRCWCRRSRERVADGPDHLNDALRVATARARRRPES